MKKQVIIKLNVEGFHNYPDPPLEVDFLGWRHRHTFEITIGFSVSHMNREIEIFIQRDKIKKHIVAEYGESVEFANRSCEMIACELLEQYMTEGAVWCEVWEEETGGARVEI